MHRLLAAALLFLPALSFGDETFQWSPQVVDFRSVPIGAELTQEVRLTNRGKQTWRILGTTTTCGCASATSKASGTLQTDADILKPDGVVTVTVTARPKRLGPANGAMFLKLEEVGKDGAGATESVGVDVRIRGTRPVALLDDHVDFGTLPCGKDFSRNVPAQLANGESFRIEKIRTSTQPLRCEIEDQRSDSASPLVKLTLLQDVRPGSFSQIVVLDLRVGDRAEQAVLRFSGEALSDFVMTPDRVVLVPDRDVEITIESRENSLFKVEECLSWPPELDVAARSFEGSGRKLSVRWTPQSGTSTKSGELILKVSGHTESRLYIPIHFLRPESEQESRK